jgi:hypothetical protein
MPLEELLRAIRTKPFIPFRLLMTNGETLEVRHPELCMPGARTIAVGLTAPSQSQAIYDVVTIVDLLHIVRLEPMPQPVSSNGSV